GKGRDGLGLATHEDGDGCEDRNENENNAHETKTVM
ncbi:MAG: hypothetical protein ACI9NQ_000604, partial [Paracoccaceae bacterium]